MSVEKNATKGTKIITKEQDKPKHKKNSSQITRKNNEFSKLSFFMPSGNRINQMPVIRDSYTIKITIYTPICLHLTINCSFYFIRHIIQQIINNLLKKYVEIPFSPNNQLIKPKNWQNNPFHAFLTPWLYIFAFFQCFWLITSSWHNLFIIIIC